MRWFREKLDDGLITVFGFILFFSSLPIAGLIVLYKGFLWLKSGEWFSFPLINFLPEEFLNTSFGQWLNHPSSWEGLHEIVAWFFTTSMEWALIGFAFYFTFGCWLLEWILKSMINGKAKDTL